MSLDTVRTRYFRFTPKNGGPSYLYKRDNYIPLIMLDKELPPTIIKFVSRYGLTEEISEEEYLAYTKTEDNTL